MGRKIFIAITVLFVLMAGAGVGAYAYDDARSDEIAQGVKVGAIDLSGMSPEEASDVLTERLLDPLAKPIRAKYENKTYVLGADRLEIEADIDGMVAEAMELSRDGSLPTRVLRYATGEELDETIEPTVTYSEEAVDAFVEEVADDLRVKAQDASVEVSTVTLAPRRGREGREVNEIRLGTRILEVLDTNSSDRTVRVPVEVTEPEVTTAEIADRYPVYLTVDRASFQLRLFKNLELVKTYTVAVGAAGYDTPTGTYEITNKAVDPAWTVPDSDWTGDLAGQVIPGGSPENPLKARWLGIYDGVGIHGTDADYSLGSSASHGCIRMSVPEVIELYDQVPVGTPIYIQ